MHRRRQSAPLTIAPALLLLLLVVAAMPRDAGAQLGPTGGHYAGRATDTGHSNVSPGGGHSASIPLDLPEPRHGLPLPLGIANGGTRFGAAGLGWDVPVSFVRRDQTFARRAPVAQILPEPRDSLSVNLLGRELDMIQAGSGWVARRGAPEIVMQQQGDNWVLQDGSGLTYTFVSRNELAGTGLWLLETIQGPGKNKVQLEYDVLEHALLGGTGVSIDLRFVSYNPDVAGVFKHRVELVYDAPQPKPLAMSVMGERALVRLRKLTGVDVAARPDASGDFQRLRSYALTYAADVDTAQLRLQSVTVSGRAGSDEANVWLPVAAYEYGSASSVHGSSGPVLRYEKTQTIPLPAGFDASKLSSTDLEGNGMSTTRQNLIDLTGDGRLDLLFPKAGGMWISRNRPGDHGTTVLDDPALGALASNAAMSSPILASREGTPRYDTDATAEGRDEVWRKLVDVNGDGRLDIVDAKATANYWTVYINEPHAAAISQIRWRKHLVPLDEIRPHLEVRGHELDSSQYIPIERRTTGMGMDKAQCYERTNGTWVLKGDYPCPPPPMDSACYSPSWPPDSFWSGTTPQTTFTEWELRDFNGDGRPDLIMNAAPVEKTVDTQPPAPGTPTMCSDYPFAGGRVATRVRPGGAGSNAVDVALNHGLLPAFSMPVRVLGSSQCGVGSTAGGSMVVTCSGNNCNYPIIDDQTDDGLQRTTCALEDVNGDGVLDRLDGNTVLLGTGSGFVDVRFDQPTSTAPALDVRSAYTNLAYHTCKYPATPTTTFDAHASASLRDVTGDGIPDLVRGTALSPGSWRVNVGTGLGYGPPIPVSMDADFNISFENERCDGNISKTLSGLYDIDGDGRPEVVSVVAGALDVYELVGSGGLRVPEAGRLTRIDNGAGAQTAIVYTSAKEDGSTAHDVPFPEVVVASVETFGTKGHGGRRSKTLYAYGGAEQMYDPVSASFHFPGYARRVQLQSESPGLEPMFVEGLATITDSYRPTPATANLTPDEQFERYMLPGMAHNVTTLAGTLSSDPRDLLATDVSTEPRRVGATHYGWVARATVEGPLNPPGPYHCDDVADPYTFGTTSMDICRTRGFLHRSSTESWRGTAAPPSAQNVVTLTQVGDVDAYGNYSRIYAANDLYRSDDDLCVDTLYATPVGPGPGRVLSAPASRYIGFCDGVGAPGGDWLAVEHWEYDKLPVGSIGDGLVTAHIVERRDTENGDLLGVIRAFDAEHDVLGNAVEFIRTREHDGATHHVVTEYDAFGLVPVRVKEEGTGAAVLETTFGLDPVTLDVVETVDPNQIATGSLFDGFGRLRQTITSASGAKEVLSSLQYLGFEGNDPEGRRIEQKFFAVPVPSPSVETAAGTITTTYLDELGRPRFKVTDMGPDYPAEVVTNAVRYDGLGRVRFAADPFPRDGSVVPHQMETTYGTTNHFNPDGTASCAVTGYGPQLLTYTTDEADERYPTCLTREFAGNAEIVGVALPDTLLPGSPQAGVVRKSTMTAIGWMVERATWQGSNRVELAEFTHNRLGAMTSMTRHRSPATGGVSVTSAWRYDSLGQVLEISEPDLSPRYHEYSSFGELVRSSVPSTQTPASPEREQLFVHDGLGRVVHREERTDGNVDADSTYDYEYDVAFAMAPAPDATNVIGRLGRALGPAGDVYLGYDWQGNVNQRMFTDGAIGDVYIERTQWNADQTLASITLQLPDSNHDEELVEYEYDSARNLTRVVSVDSAGSEMLFERIAADAMGTLRRANYGATDYEATYQESGRRLLEEMVLTSALGERRITFGPRDPMERELSREEKQDATGSTTATTYDALGRIATSVRSVGAQAVSNRSFTYDALGNPMALDDALGNDGAHMNYQPADRDKLCRIIYGGASNAPQCNVLHDATGNVVDQATRDGYRKIEYHASGAVRGISNETGASALFRYDPFGAVQELDVQGAVEDVRRDRRYGDHIERRDAISGSQSTTFISRNIPIEGTVASRRGAGGRWIFEFGESRGNRFFVESSGSFVQDTQYQPFGEAENQGEGPGSSEYTTAQWNQGDALAAFGISQLGARLYDPVIGRFLSRDPMLLPRTAASTNPYAFAANDPLNKSDPSGLDYEDDGVLSPDPLVNMAIAGYDMLMDHATGGEWSAGRDGGDVRDYDPPDPGAPTTPVAKYLKENFGQYVQSSGEGICWDCLGRTYENGLPHLKKDGLPGLEAYRWGKEVVENVNGALVRTYYVPVWGQWVELGMEVALTVAPVGRAASWMGRGVARGARVVRVGRGASRGAVGVERACTTGACSRLGTCFVEGTLVSTPSGAVAIEDIRVGHRVEAGNPACADEHLPEDAVTIGVEVDGDDSEEPLRLEMVRSRHWLAESGLLEGDAYIELEAMGIEGHARLVHVGEPPVEQAGAGCLVTSTMTRIAPLVVALRFEDGTELEATPTHPLFVEGVGWRRVDELVPGDSLRTDAGALLLASSQPSPGSRRVYNMEVDVEHTYRVTERRIHAHNDCSETFRRAWAKLHRREPLAENIMEHMPDGEFARYLEANAQSGLGSKRLYKGMRAALYRDYEALRTARPDLADWLDTLRWQPLP